MTYYKSLCTRYAKKHDAIVFTIYVFTYSLNPFNCGQNNMVLVLDVDLYLIIIRYVR